MKNLFDVVIIGGGPSGLTAALYLARARYRVVVVEKEHFGGQITITSEVVNYPGVGRISGTELTETMRKQAQDFGAEFLLAEVTGLDLDGDVKKVYTGRGELDCFGVLLATGAHPRMVGFRGEEEFRGHGVAYCATCDGEFFTGKEVFVVGGGFAAAEESIFLTKYARHVTVLIRGEDFSCAKAVADAAKSHEKISVLTNIEVESVEGDFALRKLRYRNKKTSEVTEYEAPEGESFGVFVFAGYEPATDLVKGIAELNEQGYVVTDRNQKTSVDGLYAAGDVCIKGLRQVVTAVGDGALAATELERYAAGMQKKTGLKPEMQNVQRAQAGREAAGGSAVRAGSTATDTENEAGSPFSRDIVEQLRTVFSRMEKPLVLKLSLDGAAASRELLSYVKEMASLTEKLTVEIQDQPEEEELPCVNIYRQDGTDTGLAFHGVPGGHEFTSFVLGLYNAAGPGQTVDAAVAGRIGAIDRKMDMRIMVSLSCTMCPELVVSAQRIAAANPLVRAEVYDLNLFPDRREKYQIMSVPCLILNDGKPAFGKKNIEQLLDLMENA
ncbi:MAG: FAD-dependent oxidoreductase [Lachnospiraceae bacterium]|nr:FAD-dependent oxidoreductase [Lachnospiraceae bacterium]